MSKLNQLLNETINQRESAWIAVLQNPEDFQARQKFEKAEAELNTLRQQIRANRQMHLVIHAK